jgi:hypothetical protein
MPTRKQRRRRAKELRHEYVWEDAEGNELDPEDVKEGRPGSPAEQASARPAREPQAPSWRRTFRRGLIFAPIMFVTVMLLSNDLTLLEQLAQAGFIVAIFIPFSYFLDGLMYRSYKRRLAKRTAGGGGS